MDIGGRVGGRYGRGVRYFAYGSNLWPAQLSSRCPSARALGVARLDGWRVAYRKPSSDGSAKLDAQPDPGSVAWGVVYEVSDAERPDLDKAEPGYRRLDVDVLLDGRSVGAVTYSWPGDPALVRPYDWYVATAVAGARHHGLPDHHVTSVLEADTDPDPLAAGLAPLAAHPDFPDHTGTLWQRDGTVLWVHELGGDLDVSPSTSRDAPALLRWGRRRLRLAGSPARYEPGEHP